MKTIFAVIGVIAVVWVLIDSGALRGLGNSFHQPYSEYAPEQGYAPEAGAERYEQSEYPQVEQPLAVPVPEREYVEPTPRFEYGSARYQNARPVWIGPVYRRTPRGVVLVPGHYRPASVQNKEKHVAVDLGNILSAFGKR